MNSEYMRISNVALVFQGIMLTFVWREQDHGHAANNRAGIWNSRDGRLGFNSWPGQ
jgi:hypothetical protein